MSQSQHGNGLEFYSADSSHSPTKW